MKNVLKIGVVAKDENEFKSFVDERCFPINDTRKYVFIPNILSTNSLNLDLVLLANDSLAELFRQCRSLIR